MFLRGMREAARNGHQYSQYQKMRYFHQGVIHPEEYCIFCVMIPADL